MNSLFSKATKLLASAALTSLSVIAGAILAPGVSAEVIYPLSSGQIVRFSLDNGQSINITNSAGLKDNGLVNAYAGSNTDPEQQFRVVTDGDSYLFVRNGTNFGLSSSTLTPTTGSPMVSYTTGFGNWQNFVLDRVDADHYLI